MLQKVFNRYTAGKLLVTDTQPDVSGSASFSMLVRSLISPISSNRAVFEHIVSYSALQVAVLCILNDCSSASYNGEIENYC